MKETKGKPVVKEHSSTGSRVGLTVLALLPAAAMVWWFWGGGRRALMSVEVTINGKPVGEEPIELKLAARKYRVDGEARLLKGILPPDKEKRASVLQKESQSAMAIYRNGVGAVETFDLQAEIDETGKHITFWGDIRPPKVPESYTLAVQIADYGQPIQLHGKTHHKPRVIFEHPIRFIR